MEIVLNNVAKRFNANRIFSDIDYTFKSGKKYALLGSNGSGKSTLLQLIAGNMTPSKGEIIYREGELIVEVENIYQHIAIATPYLELPEELTLTELFKLHFKFKPLMTQVNYKSLSEFCNLSASENKQLKYFSSGMKQRVRLALAFLSNTSILLLDEPCSNLDSKSIAWYRALVENFATNKLVIICSNNQSDEFDFCDEKITMESYKRN